MNERGAEMGTILNLFVTVSNVDKRNIRGVLRVCDPRNTVIKRREESINAKAEDNKIDEIRK